MQQRLTLTIKPYVVARGSEIDKAVKETVNVEEKRIAMEEMEEFLRQYKDDKYPNEDKSGKYLAIYEVKYQTMYEIAKKAYDKVSGLVSLFKNSNFSKSWNVNKAREMSIERD